MFSRTSTVFDILNHLKPSGYFMQQKVYSSKILRFANRLRLRFFCMDFRINDNSDYFPVWVLLPRNNVFTARYERNL